MTQEVWELLKKMDMKAAETQIAVHCAPLIAGIKISNLLILQKGQARRVRQLFDRAGFAQVTLYSGGQKDAILIFRNQELDSYLSCERVKKMLCRMGYRDAPPEQLLEMFALRYASYRKGQGRFPHEMGLFLGYPPEDVEGFIENGGKEALCGGYWKVYDKQQEKQLLFHGFDVAKEGLVKLVAQGFSMEDILKYA